MSGLELFDFQGRGVRALTLDGDPWFLAADVCGVLELVNPRSSLALLDEDEKGVHTMDTPGGPQATTLISESGLYSLVLRSRRKEAKVFKRWVTHEVLPAIRKTGSYSAAPARTADVTTLDRRALALMVIEAEDAKAALEARVVELEPLAVVAETMISSDGDLSVGEAAKNLHRSGINTGQNRLMAYLREIRWIDRQGHPYQTLIDNGRMSVKVGVYEHPNTGEPTISTTPRVTGKGLAELRKRLAPASIPLQRGDAVD